MTSEQPIGRAPTAARWVRALVRDKYLHLMMVLPAVYFVMFHCVPMYGITLAFKEFDIERGILGSPWAGLKHVLAFLADPYSY